MKTVKYTYLLFQLNMLLDTGKYLYVSIDDIKDKISKGTIGEFLTKTFPDADFSLIYADDWAYFTKEWEDYANSMDERRKMGIVNNGICLLVGYVINGLQQHPDLNKPKS